MTSGDQNHVTKQGPCQQNGQNRHRRPQLRPVVSGCLPEPQPNTPPASFQSVAEVTAPATEALASAGQPTLAAQVGTAKRAPVAARPIRMILANLCRHPPSARPDRHTEPIEGTQRTSKNQVPDKGQTGRTQIARVSRHGKAGQSTRLHRANCLLAAFRLQVPQATAWSRLSLIWKRSADEGSGKHVAGNEGLPRFSQEPTGFQFTPASNENRLCLEPSSKHSFPPQVSG